MSPPKTPPAKPARKTPVASRATTQAASPSAAADAVPAAAQRKAAARKRPATAPATTAPAAPPAATGAAAPVPTPLPPPAPTPAPVPAKARAARSKPAAKPRAGRSAANDAGPGQTLPIYQIYFEAGQRAGLDPSFIPLDNADHGDPLREFAVFERLAADEGLRLVPLWGALSWRFSSKTGMDGRALRQAIAAHPGQDLYYCNPYPEHEALYANGWQQGIVSHPAFDELCAAVFKAAGLDTVELRAVQSAQAFSACNYFVASPAFWSAYLPWVRGVLDRARAGVAKPLLRVLDSRLSDPQNRHAGSTYWPFIVERLLPLFLRSAAGQGLKTHKLVLPVPEARLNSHLQRLREMKDVAHRTRSRWLYACWLNYRNLYLLQTAGADWCKRYLNRISPTELEFR